MPDLGKKHRVIGIRHVLRQFKDAGLIEEESYFAKDAVANVQDELTSKAVTWYKVGAKRGAREVLNALLDGRLTVRRGTGGTIEVEAHVDAIKWKKRLNVSAGNEKNTVRSRTYRLTTKDLGFE